MQAGGQVKKATAEENFPLPTAHLSLTNVQAICSTLHTLFFSPESWKKVHINVWI